MSISKLLSHSWHVYSQNAKLISFFSIPFLVAFPLALLLPNFIAVAGVFLRFESLQSDLDLTGAAIILAAFLLALLLFSFAVAAINVIIKHQRTMTRVSTSDFDNIEVATFKLFGIFLAAFLVILFANFLILEYWADAPVWLAPLFTLLVSLSVLFAPQAVVLEEVHLLSAIKRSVAIICTRFYYFVFFICLASILLLANGYVFLHLERYAYWWAYVGVAVNALILTPFFEVLKSQIFLSKYPLLK